MDSNDLELMGQEYEAWAVTNDELKELGYEDGWNNPKLQKLHKKIVFWGEMLALIRTKQAHATIERAKSSNNELDKFATEIV
jgi:hypothetical protein